MSNARNKFSPEVRERAVRMVGEHRADYGSEWAAMTSIAGKIGCTAETLRRWCREEASPKRFWLAGPAGQAASERERLKLLEREVKELRRANEILRKASAYFAQGEGRAAPLQAMPERSTAKANGDVVHRRSSRGTGYRADLPRTAGRPFLLARTCRAPRRPGQAFGPGPT